jgi:hypothetical protein
MITVWTLRGLKKKNRIIIRRMWVHPIICNWLYWTTFQDLRREEAKLLIILECRWTLSRTLLTNEHSKRERERDRHE